MQCVSNFKPSSKIECEEVISLSSATMENLQIVQKFLNLFDKYINQVNRRNRDNNLHCASLISTLVNRKDHINAEYTKFSNQMDDIIGYFLSCSMHVSAQLDAQELINFLVNK